MNACNWTGFKRLHKNSGLNFIGGREGGKEGERGDGEGRKRGREGEKERGRE